MKHKIFTVFIALIASVGTIFAWDYEQVLIGNLYYNLDFTNQTAEVTYQYGSDANYSSLTAANIPETVEYNTFTYNVTSIGHHAFANCYNLTSVTIPNNITSIESDAFKGCSNLTSVTLNSNYIVSKTYADYYNIKDIFGDQVVEYIIGGDVTSIGDWGFSDCSCLTSVTIGKSVTSIGKWTFDGCTGLTSIIIPKSVTSLGYGAFAHCYNLASVNIPNSVTSIGPSAFFLCSGLASIVVENGNSVYDSRNNCNAIIETATNTLVTGCQNTMIPNSITSIGNDAFVGCIGLTSVIIPNSVISIGYEAFDGCTGLTSVIIPNSVTSIGADAFAQCDLTSIVVESANSVYDSRNNCNAIIETATNTLVSGCKNTIIPNSITSIGKGAFFDCTGLTSIIIPGNVTSIGSGAFSSCTSLKSITCKAVTPPSLEGKEEVFYKVDKSIPLYVHTGSVYAYANANQWKEFTNIRGIEMAIDEVATGVAPGTKTIRNGQLYIQRGNELFNAQGARVK